MVESSTTPAKNMKTQSILQVIGGGLALLAVAGSLHAQGTVSFNNRVPGVVVAPVYGPEPTNASLALFGNTSTGTPAGGTAYGGALLAGTSYTAELWAGPQGTPDAGLSAVARTTFRTASFSGFVVPVSSVAVPSVGPGGIATLQVRVWNNQSNTVTSWAAAQANTNVASGASLLFDSPPLTVPPSTPVNLWGLQSFNIHLPAIATTHFKMPRATISGGGGGRASSAHFSMSSTLGQPAVGGSMTSASFSLASGVWALEPVQTSGAPFLSIVPATPGWARISWMPTNASNFVLQVTAALTPPAWSNAPSGPTNPVIVPATLPKRFYRLFKP
jgi:hypothetical protein